MGKRGKRSSRKSVEDRDAEVSKSGELDEKSEPVSGDFQEISKFDPVEDPKIIVNENFLGVVDSECENRDNMTPGLFIEVNNNSKEEVDKNSTAVVANIETQTKHQKGSSDASPSEPVVCKQLRKFLKKSIKKADNIDDDNVFINLFKTKKLHHLCREAAKSHNTSSMSSLPYDKIILLLKFLDRIIGIGNQLLISYSQDNRYVLTDKSDPVFKAIYASLMELYIWTSPGIDNKLIEDDGVESLTLFLNLSLQNIIFPAFNSSHQVNEGSTEACKKKKIGNNKVNGAILQLYNDLIEAVRVLEVFLKDQTLIDTHILRINSFSIAAFFVRKTGNIQLALLKLVECVFSKYKDHRKAILDDILSYLVKLSADRSQYELYKLMESEEKIQMHSALIMKIIQSVAYFSPEVVKQDKVDFKVIAEEKVADVRSFALYFWHQLFGMCCSKANEGCRTTITTLIQDLLLTVDLPQWPVSELMLYMLVFELLENQATTQQNKLLALELLTAVYSGLQKKSTQHKENMHKIDQLFENIKHSELDQIEKKCKKLSFEYATEKVQFLQNALLDFISHRESTEPGLLYAKHLHLANWYIEMAKLLNDSTTATKKIQAEKRKTNVGKTSKTSKGKSPGKKPVLSQNNSKMKFLLDKYHDKTVQNANNFAKGKTNLFVDADAAQLIVHHFESQRPLLIKFDQYLEMLLNGLKDASIPVRLKAMRCLSHLIVVSPDLISRNSVETTVKKSVFDQTSIAIRESAIDIISKIVLSKTEIDDDNIAILLDRLLDTGVSVRKKVIKTLGDLCAKFPESQKTPDIASKIMKRINDEPGVHNMVLEFFYRIWFQPINTESEPDVLNERISFIVKVMNVCTGIGMDLFETLLTSLINLNEDTCDRRGLKNVSAEDIVHVCKQLFDGLVMHLIDVSREVESTSQCRLLPVMACILSFAKIKPKFVVPYIDAIQKLLNDNYQTTNKSLINCILRTIELAIPCIKHPNETMLSNLECNFEKIIMIQEPTVIQNCISCMQTCTEKLTQNYDIVAAIMKKRYDFLVKFFSHFKEMKSLGNNGCESETIANNQLISRFKRSLFIVGLLMRYFNFCNKNVCGENLPLTITSDVVNLLDGLMRSANGEMKVHATMAIGNVCVRFCKLMLRPGLKGLYCDFLRNVDNDNLKVQVLHNLKTFLENDRQRKIAQYNDWKEQSKKESLKRMEDVSSGLSSTIIQNFLSDILKLTVHKKFKVRQPAQTLIQIILQQGLVNPVQLVSNMIALSTEDNECLRMSAEKHIQDIEQRYPGFIHMKAQQGLELAFQLQETLQSNSTVVHGFRESKNGNREALLGFLYSTLHAKPHKRAFITSIIKRFEEHLTANPKMMPFLVDNLAYFDYKVIDEPLFIIHSIDVFLSVYGTGILQSFEEALIPADINNNSNKSNEEKGMEKSDGAIENKEEEEEEELMKEDNVDELMERLPENIQPLVDCLKTTDKYLLLISLNQFLKAVFNISDCMMYGYSPSDKTKAYEKPVLRSKKENFDVEHIMQQIENYTLDCSEDARKAVIENYIKFKSLIMRFDINRSGCDDYDIPTSYVTNLVSKNVEKSQITKRRSSTKSKKSDVNFTPKNSKKTRTPKSEKNTASKNRRSRSITPERVVKRRLTRSSLENE